MAYNIEDALLKGIDSWVNFVAKIITSGEIVEYTTKDDKTRRYFTITATAGERLVSIRVYKLDIRRLLGLDCPTSSSR